jgi:hypothetical protein
MSSTKTIFKVSKRNLLLYGGIGWLGTSIYLIYRGVSHILDDNIALALRLGIAIPVGLALYFFLFRRVINHYIDRIYNLKSTKAVFLSFMGYKSYVLLLVMSGITFSIELYKVIALDYLFTFQTIMSVPILLSSIMFFKAWKSY